MRGTAASDPKPARTPGQICGTVFLRERKRLHRIQAELIGLVIVGDVASRGLRRQPLAQIALIGLRLGGKLGGTSSADRRGPYIAPTSPR